MSGCARPTPSTRSSISTRPCAIPTIRPGCCRSTIAATTFTRATWGTARWATPSSSRCSTEADHGVARLTGKIAAVTGGASGIGEATVRRFVAEGAKVALADRDVDRGKRVAAEIEASGGQALFVEAHMEREAEAAAFVQQAADRFGRLDVLVNNAGIRMYQTVVEASAESWDEILGVNLKGYVFCAKAAIPVIRQGGGGSIVNVASVDRKSTRLNSSHTVISYAVFCLKKKREQK